MHGKYVVGTERLEILLEFFTVIQPIGALIYPGNLKSVNGSIAQYLLGLRIAFAGNDKSAVLRVNQFKFTIVEFQAIGFLDLRCQG